MVRYNRRYVAPERKREGEEREREEIMAERELAIGSLVLCLLRDGKLIRLAIMDLMIS